MSGLFLSRMKNSEMQTYKNISQKRIWLSGTLANNAVDTLRDIEKQIVCKDKTTDMQVEADTQLIAPN